jgi:hypothetical protein
MIIDCVADLHGNKPIRIILEGKLEFQVVGNGKG